MPESTTPEQYQPQNKEKLPRYISEEDVTELIALLDSPHIEQNTNHDRIKSENAIRARKERYLRQLPINIVDQLYGHLMNEILIESEKEKQYNELLAEQGKPTLPVFSLEQLISAEINHNLPPNQIRPSGKIKGELFEIISEIQANNEGYRVKNKKLSAEAKAELEEMSQILLAVAHNPDVFGLNQFKSVRNPDLAWMQVDNLGNLVVKAIAEAKSSDHLDSRAYSQIRETGFRATLKKLADAINEMPNAEIHGLKGFGIGGKKIFIDPEIIQYIIVCHGLKPKNNFQYEQLVAPTKYDRNPLNKTDQQAFIEQLSNDNQTKIIESPFTREELKKITGILMNKILEKTKQATL